MNNKNRKDKKNSLGGLIAVAVIILMNLASTGAGSELLAVLIVFAAVIAVIVAVVVIMKKSLGTGKVNVPNAGKISSYLNREEKEEKTFVRREPVTASYDEKAQENNFHRDRAKRLAQLDVFLKNGIIEKEEYNILKSRYLKEKL